MFFLALRKGTRTKMEHRLRLVQGSNNSQLSEKRAAARRPISVPGQIVWKDARGTTRMASVVTRDVSETGVSVECLEGPAIPLYRIVYFQVDRSARSRTDLPAACGARTCCRRSSGSAARPAHRQAHRVRAPAPGRTEVQVHGGRYPGIAVRVVRATKPSSFLRVPAGHPRHKRTAGTRRPPW